MITLSDVYTYYLDELAFLARQATHCPLGPADPDQPSHGWAYTLATDLGGQLSTLIKADAVQFHRVLTLWHPHSRRRFTWHVSWDTVTGWHDYWTFMDGDQRTWLPYPADLWSQWAVEGLPPYVASAS